MEPHSEPHRRTPPVKGKRKKSTKHSVKFKEQGDQEVLVVTVEPPSPSPGSPEPAKTAVTFALPPLSPPRRPKASSSGGRSPKREGAHKKASGAGEQRLSEGCTSLMYACQQGLTGDILKELRQKFPGMIAPSVKSCSIVSRGMSLGCLPVPCFDDDLR
ncbi:hypothetical protein ZHAS_00015679 [Anopheles sinensis]|uniref:Uncharacterized protein n=1 Tax=Anopheles sinensis TaxID=74873 RepID=A0A084WBP4_ANOSI|nr:hypothetical protein ZHAS_00015679 [Anopheles sinensis]